MKEKSVLVLYVVLLSISKSYSQTETEPSSSSSPPPVECDTYCFKNCDKYFNKIDQKDYHSPPGIWMSSMMFYYHAQKFNDYNDCVRANNQCQCNAQFTLKNPLLWMAMGSMGLLLIFFIYYICRRYEIYNPRRLFRRRSSGSTPVIPTVNTITNYNSTAFTDWYRGDDYEDKPPMYEPPPSYIDIFRKSSKDKESEANQAVPPTLNLT